MGKIEKSKTKGNGFFYVVDEDTCCKKLIK